MLKYLDDNFSGYILDFFLNLAEFRKKSTCIDKKKPIFILHLSMSLKRAFSAPTKKKTKLSSQLKNIKILA